MSLITVERVFPNGRQYLEFMLNNNLIGRAEKVNDGYLIWGKRKSRSTKKQAAKQMINDKIKKSQREMAFWIELFKTLENEIE